MSLQSDVKTICETLYPGATVIFSSVFSSNISAFNMSSSEFPLIVIDNESPVDGEIKINNNFQDNTTIRVRCLNQDFSENTDDQTEEIRAAMEVYAKRICAQIYQKLDVRPINRQKYRLIPNFHFMSSDLSGVTLEMQVNYNNIVNFDA